MLTIHRNPFVPKKFNDTLIHRLQSGRQVLLAQITHEPIGVTLVLRQCGITYSPPKRPPNTSIGRYMLCLPQLYHPIKSRQINNNSFLAAPVQNLNLTIAGIFRYARPKAGTKHCMILASLEEHYKMYEQIKKFIGLTKEVDITYV
jgi:hypothetical protein